MRKSKAMNFDDNRTPFTIKEGHAMQSSGKDCILFFGDMAVDIHCPQMLLVKVCRVQDG